MSQHATLYSFRRCPYAMRARLAIKSSGVSVELREIVLRNKPEHMLAISPKGTVPVLLLANGDIVDESWDIVHWATAQKDPNNLRGTSERIEEANRLVQQNDQTFKQHLDHYKYADRFPEFPAEHYRAQGEAFLLTLDQRLAQHEFLIDDQSSLADIGIFPFIRQFAHVDIEWFRQTSYTHLHRWFDRYLNSDLFASIMTKYTPWQEGDTPLTF
ncbi:MAG: glutathione S-transferase [Cycloclasticus sp. symbiont of Bathymodiolus heckerae]|nr:MAG: glutathione S-transferase [Cycloclasticus sp. symbiont of Bathymodiolus heckerae]